MNPHRHDETCKPNCIREVEISGATPTGLFKLAKIKKQRGHLRNGESLMWWFAWHFWQALGKGAGQVLGLLGLLAVMLLAKACGVKLEMP